jgi:hypothetical protein
MPNELYKGHLLLWTAEHDDERQAWIPTMQISWKINGQFQFHRFKGPPQTSKEGATQVAQKLAELWIDKKL